MGQVRPRPGLHRASGSAVAWLRSLTPATLHLLRLSLVRHVRVQCPPWSDVLHGRRLHSGQEDLLPRDARSAARLVGHAANEASADRSEKAESVKQYDVTGQTVSCCRLYRGLEQKVESATYL